MNIEEKLSSLRRADAGTDQVIAEHYPANWDMDAVFRKAYKKYQSKVPYEPEALPKMEEKQEKPRIFNIPLQRFVAAACLVLAVGIAGTFGIMKLSMREPDTMSPDETAVTTETTKSTLRVHGPAVTTVKTTADDNRYTRTVYVPKYTDSPVQTDTLTAPSPSGDETQISLTLTQNPATDAAQTANAGGETTAPSGMTFTSGTTMTTTMLIPSARTTTTTTFTTQAAQLTVTTARTTATKAATRTARASVPAVTQTSRVQTTEPLEEKGGNTENPPERPSGVVPVTDEPEGGKNTIRVNDRGNQFTVEFTFPDTGKDYAPTKPRIGTDHFHISEDGGGLYRIDDDWSHHSGYLRLYSGSGVQSVPFDKNEYSRWEETSVNGETAYLVYGSHNSWLLWFDGAYFCALYTEQGFEYNLPWMAEALDTH